MGEIETVCQKLGGTRGPWARSLRNSISGNWQTAHIATFLIKRALKAANPTPSRSSSVSDLPPI